MNKKTKLSLAILLILTSTTSFAGIVSFINQAPSQENISLIEKDINKNRATKINEIILANQKNLAIDSSENMLFGNLTGNFYPQILSLQSNLISKVTIQSINVSSKIFNNKARNNYTTYGIFTPVGTWSPLLEDYFENEDVRQSRDMERIRYDFALENGLWKTTVSIQNLVENNFAKGLKEYWTFLRKDKTGENITSQTEWLPSEVDYFENETVNQSRDVVTTSEFQDVEIRPKTSETRVSDIKTYEDTTTAENRTINGLKEYWIFSRKDKISETITSQTEWLPSEIDYFENETVNQSREVVTTSEFQDVEIRPKTNETRVSDIKTYEDTTTTENRTINGLKEYWEASIDESSPVNETEISATDWTPDPILYSTSEDVLQTRTITKEYTYNSIEVRPKTNETRITGQYTKQVALEETRTIKGTKIPIPLTIDLDSSVDSGYNNEDNITNIQGLVINGTASQNSLVNLHKNNSTSILASTIADENGNWSITLPNQAAGVMTFVAKEMQNSTVVSSSDPLSVTIDIAKPTTPASTNPSILDTTDSGAKGDFTTSFVQPILKTSVTTLTKSLFYLNGVKVGETVFNTAGGTSVIPLTSITPLTDGIYEMSVISEDYSGNTSTLRTFAQKLTIDTTRDPAPNLTISTPNWDNGTITNDNITTLYPEFEVIITPGYTASIYYNNTYLRGCTADVNGSCKTVSSGLPNGYHSMTAIVTDKAGNLSYTSNEIIVDKRSVAP